VSQIAQDDGAGRGARTTPPESLDQLEVSQLVPRTHTATHAAAERTQARRFTRSARKPLYLPRATALEFEGWSASIRPSAGAEPSTGAGPSRTDAVLKQQDLRLRWRVQRLKERVQGVERVWLEGGQGGTVQVRPVRSWERPTGVAKCPVSVWPPARATEDKVDSVAIAV
jgi:hypothetical protein